MPLDRHAIDRHLARNHGVVDRPTLVRFGATTDQIERLVRSGVFASPRKSVYRLSAAPQTFEQKVALACSAVPKVVVASHATAARLLGLVHVPATDSGTIHVTVPPQRRVRIPSVRMHYATLHSADRLTSAQGLPCTTPARTICDLAAVLDDETLERVIEAALHARLVRVALIEATACRAGSRGRKGAARLTRVLASRPEGSTSASAIELCLYHALVASGLPAPKRNYRLTLPDGRWIRADLYWPDQRLVCEVDHHHWHAETFDRTTDAWRDRQTAMLGVRTVRLTDRDIRERLTRVVADIAAILRTPASF